MRAALTVGESGNPRSLVSLDASGEGRAVIIIGDASTADYVDYLVPGMFSDVDTQIVAFADSSDNIATRQQAWIKTLNPGVPALPVADRRHRSRGSGTRRPTSSTWHPCSWRARVRRR